MSEKFNLSITSDKVKIVFSTQAEFIDFLDELSVHTEVVDFPVTHLSVLHEPNGDGLFLDFAREELALTHVPIEAVADTLASGENSEGVEGSQMVLFVKDKETGKLTTELLSNYGLRTLAERAEALSSGFFKFLNKSDQETVLNIHTKSMERNKNTSAIKRGYKFRAFRGEEFVDLPTEIMARAVIETLNKDFNGAQFEFAEFTHDETYALWTTPAQLDLVTEYNDKLLEVGADMEERFIPAFEFVTSDVGKSAASIRTLLISGDQAVGIGTPVKVVHKDESKIEDFTDELDFLFARAQTNISSLLKLLSIPIKHPANAAMYIQENIRGLGKVPLRVAVERYEETNGTGPGTAHDVFFILQDALQIMKDRGRAESTISNSEEDLVKLLSDRFKWSDYDLATRPDL